MFVREEMHLDGYGRRCCNNNDFDGGNEMQFGMGFRALTFGALAAGLMASAASAQTQVVRFLHNETDPPSIEFFMITSQSTCA